MSVVHTTRTPRRHQLSHYRTSSTRVFPHDTCFINKGRLQPTADDAALPSINIYILRKWLETRSDARSATHDVRASSLNFSTRHKKYFSHSLDPPGAIIYIILSAHLPVAHMPIINVYLHIIVEDGIIIFWLGLPSKSTLRQQRKFLLIR